MKDEASTSLDQTWHKHPTCNIRRRMCARLWIAKNLQKRTCRNVLGCFRTTFVNTKQDCMQTPSDLLRTCLTNFPDNVVPHTQEPKTEAKAKKAAGDEPQYVEAFLGLYVKPSLFEPPSRLCMYSLKPSLCNTILSKKSSVRRRMHTRHTRMLIGGP